MNQGKTIFTQIMEFLPLEEFRKCVNRYQGNYRSKSFSCLDQFYCMAFAQLTFRESLRDIEACLRSVPTKLYHMGFRAKVARSTLAKANENRDWHIYADFAQILMRTAKKLYADEEFGIEIDQAAYALDSTIIDLCFSLCPWAQWQRQKGAVKLHTLLSLKGDIPLLAKVTTALIHDSEFLDEVIPEPGAFYIMDRGYIDLSRFFLLNRNFAFFVTREKAEINWQRLYSRPVDKLTGLRCDQTISFTGRYSAKDYPEKLRRIRFFDSKNNRYFVFWTNNFILPAITIAQLYLFRWQIELFFKWIKQHLRIKTFYGTSENAVKTQIWIAITVYLLIAIIKKRLKFQFSLYTFLQILSVTVFEKAQLYQVVTKDDCKNKITENHNQLELFNL